MQDSRNMKNLHMLKNLLGDDLFLTVADVLAGQRLSFPKRLDSMDKSGRNQAILKEYNDGASVDEIGLNYDLERSQVYKIIEKTSLL